MKTYKKTLQEVKIEEIDFSERSYLFSYPERSSLLIESIKEYGLIDLPLLILGEKGYIIVSGEGRVNALKKLSYISFQALILPSTLSKAELLLIALEANLWRGLNLVEKAFFIEKAELFFPKETLINILPKLGFSPHIKWYYFLKNLLKLEKPYYDLLVKNELNPKMIELLSDLSGYEREEFLEIFHKIKPTFNEQREILETLLDLKRRENLSSLLTPELKKILEEKEINLRKKNFFEAIEKIRFPNYYRKKEQIVKIKQNFLEKDIRVDFSPYLEKKEITFYINSKNFDDLKKKVAFIDSYGKELFRIFED
ncbi:MAG: ParB/RepB/Spo0J family partition protein [Caldimicrobium sp.]